MNAHTLGHQAPGRPTPGRSTPGHSTAGPSSAWQQLLRDLRRNPKKAGLLALLAGVALWFWAPLCIGWIKGEELANAVADQAAPPLASPLATGPQGTAVAEAAKAAEAVTHTWQQLVKWMEQDPRRKADDIRLERDPFAPPPKPPVKTAPEAPQSVASLANDPAQIGLKLSGTLLGPERRLALINGRAYAEGQTVKASADAAFVVRRIEAKRVTLERGGKSLVLEAVKPRP